MNEVNPLQSFLDLTALIAGQAFGTWQFWTVWGVGFVILLIFGKIFARGIGKSEKAFITVFIGNALVVLALLAAAWVIQTFAAPQMKDAFVVALVSAVSAGILGFFFIMLFGKVFWTDNRGTALMACVFALAISYGAMFATDKIMDVVVQGQGTIQKQQAPLKETAQ